MSRRSVSFFSRAWIGLSITLLYLLAAPGPCRGQSELRWELPVGCSSAEQARGEIEQRLGQKLDSLPKQLSASVQVRALAAGGFEAVIRTHSATTAPRRPADGLRASTHERRLYDRDCSALARAAALVVALTLELNLRESAHAAERAASTGQSTRSRTSAASGERATALGSETASAAASATLDSSLARPRARFDEADTGAAVDAPREAQAAPVPSALARGPTPPGRAAPVADDAPPSLPAPEPARMTREAGPARSRLGGSAGLDVGIAHGVLPGLTVPVSVHARLALASLEASVRLTYTAPGSASLPEAPGSGGRVSLVAGALQAGLRLRRGRLELPLGVGLESGLFIANGRGAQSHERGYAGWLAALGAGELRWMLLANWALRLRVEGLVALRRPSFALAESDGSVHRFYRPKPAAVRVAIGVEVRFR